LTGLPAVAFEVDQDSHYRPPPPGYGEAACGFSRRFKSEGWAHQFAGPILRRGRAKVAGFPEIARPKFQQEETEKTESLIL
jgi:hypothetical protein